MNEALENAPIAGSALDATTLVDTVFAILGVEQGEDLRNSHAPAHTSRSDEPWVLSIEDDPDVALALRVRLEQYGVRVLHAGAGAAGYRQAFLQSPRAILLDYELPEGNGDYVLRRLKESPVTQDIPVIVLTGRHDKSVERQMRTLGASEYLTKPFDWNRLLAAMDDLLDTVADDEPW